MSECRDTDWNAPMLWSTKPADQESKRLKDELNDLKALVQVMWFGSAPAAWKPTTEKHIVNEMTRLGIEVK